jgi:hypothetical protein
MQVGPRDPGIRVTTNGNQLVSYDTEARITDGGVFYPITPSTEMGENYQLAFAEGKLNVFGRSKLAIETEGEHFQNVSKALLQNRPNVKMLMLDTQVYSNTGGQNSDSSPMTGGFDMNQLGAATQGKLIEEKGLAETLLSGHGSPFVAQECAAADLRIRGASLVKEEVARRSSKPATAGPPSGSAAQERA